MAYDSEVKKQITIALLQSSGDQNHLQGMHTPQRNPGCQVATLGSIDSGSWGSGCRAKKSSIDVSTGAEAWALRPAPIAAFQSTGSSSSPSVYTAIFSPSAQVN